MSTAQRGYVFDNRNPHSAEQHRCLAAAFDPMTTGRLTATGVTDGWHCLEIGCGAGSIARWLADRVAPSGTVLATDIDPCAVPPRPNLTVVPHDVVTDPLPEGRFDLIVVRLVLQHLPEREAVLAKLVTALKPGGWLQVDEFDAAYEPVLLTSTGEATRLYEKFLAAKKALMRSAGGDPEWGRHVARAMHGAGLVDIDPRPHVMLRHPGAEVLRIQAHHTHHLRDGLVSHGMTDEELAEVRAVMGDPVFRASSSLVYSVHGRKRGQR